MGDFQKDYFEAETFWQGDMLNDPFNNERIASTIKIIPEEVKTLADIGCGNGVFLNALKKRVGSLIDLVGVDRSKTALKYVQTKRIEGDITCLPFDDKSFDCVTSLEVIEHLPVHSFQSALKELARVSSKYVIISVPFQENLKDNFTTCPSCQSTFNRDLHMRSFSEKDFIVLLADYGFRNIAVEKVGKITTYIGQRAYRKIVHGDSTKFWHSPVCPICGYQSEMQDDQVRNGAGNQHSLLSNLLKLPKKIWPKQVQYYWILGLFVKTNDI